MKRLAVALLSLALVAAACGDDDAVDAASLDSCEGLAAAGIALLQSAIDVIDEMDAANFAALAESDERPAEFAELEVSVRELTARADDLGCSNEQRATLMAQRVDELSSDSVIGQLIIEGVRAGDVGFFDEFFGD